MTSINLYRYLKDADWNYKYIQYLVEFPLRLAEEAGGVGIDDRICWVYICGGSEESTFRSPYDVFFAYGSSGEYCPRRRLRARGLSNGPQDLLSAASDSKLSAMATDHRHYEELQNMAIQYFMMQADFIEVRDLLKLASGVTELFWTGHDADPEPSIWPTPSFVPSTGSSKSTPGAAPEPPTGQRFEKAQRSYRNQMRRYRPRGFRRSTGRQRNVWDDAEAPPPPPGARSCPPLSLTGLCMAQSSPSEPLQIMNLTEFSDDRTGFIVTKRSATAEAGG
ncbi:hypothetical protein QBC37DRAFT_449725 [Rhypophila decipiens]|uniref:Uncharacterized protein n=1 Tax=Rhypophila decipiens TaxID=261697 RepID=A0AAN6XZE5_9PEZI|nr:hypothetical protein QBC37DRAFT_449725 [Rhypophila decipiens]